jgi:hypothetical protein
MKNKKMVKLMMVLVLAAVAMPGCYFSSAQLIDTLGAGTATAPGLAATLINAVYDVALNQLLNPAGKDDPTRQSFVDLSKRTATTLTNSWIGSEIPLDPGSIK